ncbi:protein of unknown function [Pararobbsia alpina]
MDFARSNASRALTCRPSIAVARSAIARPDTNCSSGAPSSANRTSFGTPRSEYPISPAAPFAPWSTLPSMTAAAASPVPTLTYSPCRTPASAPQRASASAAALTSVSTRIASTSKPARSTRSSGKRSQPGLFGASRMPSGSTMPGVTAATACSDSRVAAVVSRTRFEAASNILSSTRSAPSSASVGISHSRRRSPVGAAVAIAIFVPPKSIASRHPGAGRVGESLATVRSEPERECTPSASLVTTPLESRVVFIYVSSQAFRLGVVLLFRPACQAGLSGLPLRFALEVCR